MNSLKHPYVIEQKGTNREQIFPQIKQKVICTVSLIYVHTDSNKFTRERHAKTFHTSPNNVSFHELFVTSG